MDTKFSRAAWVSRAGVLLATTCFFFGCKSAPVNPFAARTETKESPDEADPEEPDPVASNEAKPGEGELDLKVLENDGWFEQASPLFAKRVDSFVRWHNHLIDPLALKAAENRPDLSASLASDNPVVAGNAAIVSGHWGHAQAVPQLIAAARAKQLRGNMRLAAVEALGKIDEPSPAKELRGLLQQFAPLKPQKDIQGQEEQPIPELHAELIRALARHAEPGDEAWFTAALRSRAWLVRYEGIIAWTGVEAELPSIAIDLRSDSDPRVRAAALVCIAEHRDPHSVEYLQQGMADRSLEVQAVAIAALGRLGSDDATRLLGKLKDSRSELARAATVTAMAAAGLQDDVLAAAKDTSQHVRLAVAQTLKDAASEGQQIAAQSLATAHDLVRDASSDVQRQAVESLAGWPVEQAGPVLLLAIAEGGYSARKAAAAQLAERWPPAADFPVDAVAERRATAIAELRKLWVTQYGEINDAVVAAKDEARRLVAVSEDRVREVQQLVANLEQQNLAAAARREIVARLNAEGPQLVAVLEQSLELSVNLPPELFEEVLPAASTTFAALRRLSSNDVLQRRTAAAELAGMAGATALTPLAVERLAHLMEAEKDPAVWRNALLAVDHDTRGAGVRMAYMAVGNASIEVRRKACDFLAAHGDARHVPVLLPMLDDADGTVVLAAVRAMGAVESLADPQPLLRLLNLPDKHVRMEAALSLARLHHEQGATALERLALDTDLEVRLRAAQAMGEIANPVFLPALMAMLGDKPDAVRVAMISLEQIARTNPAADENGTPLAADEKIRRWQAWYREHQERAAAAE